jgi:hypothetical protein
MTDWENFSEYKNYEITPGKKTKWRYVKGQRQISIGDDTEITLPFNYF